MTIELKAKRGDAVLIIRTDSCTYMHGPTTRTTVYCLARVTSVKRDGQWKTAERPRECSWPWTFANDGGRCWIIPADRLGGDVESFLRTLGQTTDFPSVERAQEVIRMEVARISPAA